jgi:hypothetical protein
MLPIAFLMRQWRIEDDSEVRSRPGEKEGLDVAVDAETLMQGL